MFLPAKSENIVDRSNEKRRCFNMKSHDQEIAVNNQKEEAELFRTHNKEKIIHRAKYEKQGKSESKLLDAFDQMNGRTSATKGACK